MVQRVSALAAYLLAAVPAAAMLCTCSAPSAYRGQCGYVAATNQEYVCPVAVCCSLAGMCTRDVSQCLTSNGATPNYRYFYNMQGACQGVDSSGEGDFCPTPTPSPSDEQESSESGSGGFPIWAIGPIVGGCVLVLSSLATACWFMRMRHAGNDGPAPFVNRSDMGRVFAAPASSKNAGELFLNIGFNAKGGQCFPSYPPHLQGHVSRTAYDALVGDLREFFDAHNTGSAPLYLMFAMLPCCLFTGVTCCWCLYMKRKVDAMDALLRDIVEKHSRSAFGGALRVERFDIAQRTGNRPEDMAFDSSGLRLERQVSDEGLVPMWPPLGYNLIVGRGGWTPQANGMVAWAPQPETMGAESV